ncbi:MAG: HD domain-containing protein [Actinomycetota bacterium]
MDQTRIVKLASERDEELAQRLDFLLEIDRLKTVMRRSRLVDASRYENTAEHSWHLGLFAMVLQPYAPEGTDPARAVEMLLVHDLVEIDAGDTYIYDTAGRADKQEREQAAATRLFGLLPPEQGRSMAGLWHEYEARETPTARFAYAVDRLQPVLLNAASGGRSWSENGIRHSQPMAVNRPIGDAAPPLWALVEQILTEATDEGVLIDDRVGVGDAD